MKTGKYTSIEQRRITVNDSVILTQEEWDKGELFVTDFARDGEVLFAA